MSQIISPFEDLKSYFQELAGLHRQVAGSFVHGDVRRFKERTRSSLTYPCLWLETPGQALRDNGAGSVTVEQVGAFCILWNSPDSSPDEQDQIWAQTNRIALEFVARIRHDARQRAQNLIAAEAFSLDPLDTLFVDNDFGWRVEFSLKKPIDLCHSSEPWNNA